MFVTRVSLLSEMEESLREPLALVVSRPVGCHFVAGDTVGLVCDKEQTWKLETQKCSVMTSLVS